MIITNDMGVPYIFENTYTNRMSMKKFEERVLQSRDETIVILPLIPRNKKMNLLPSDSSNIHKQLFEEMSKISKISKIKKGTTPMESSIHKKEVLSSLLHNEFFVTLYYTTAFLATKYIFSQFSKRKTENSPTVNYTILCPNSFFLIKSLHAFGFVPVRNNITETHTNRKKSKQKERNRENITIHDFIQREIAFQKVVSEEESESSLVQLSLSDICVRSSS
jgi:hypothetical protein